MNTSGCLRTVDLKNVIYQVGVSVPLNDKLSVMASVRFENAD